MDRRFLTVLGVSLVFALVVSSVFWQMTARSSSPEAPAPSQEVDVVIAARPLSVGVMIKTPDIKLVKYPSSAVPKGAFTKVEEVLDRPVVSNVLLDEPILEGRLAAKGSGLGLAPTIPVGMRAVTVRVNDVAGVAGFVLPGMHVDVLVTGTPPNTEGATTMTNTVLQNMLILSAGKELQADARGNAMPTPTVTIMATPAEAETLTLANNSGQIQLVLRNSSDQAVADTSGSFVSELYGGHKRPKVTSDPAPAPRPRAPRSEPRPEPAAQTAIAPPPPPPPAAPPEVIMIRGTQRTVEVVGKPANQ
jgi:pilus assembly protein CpaB